jgi:hypothetical protein
MTHRSSVVGFFYNYNAHLKRVFEHWELDLIFKSNCKFQPKNSEFSEVSEMNRKEETLKMGQISLNFMRKSLCAISKDFSNCHRILPKISLYDQVKKGEIETSALVTSSMAEEAL